MILAQSRQSDQSNCSLPKKRILNSRGLFEIQTGSELASYTVVSFAL